MLGEVPRQELQGDALLVGAQGDLEEARPTALMLHDALDKVPEAHFHLVNDTVCEFILKRGGGSDHYQRGGQRTSLLQSFCLSSYCSALLTQNPPDSTLHSPSSLPPSLTITCISAEMV